MDGRLKLLLTRITLRVSLQEQILFARHLAIMTKAGISLLKSITLLQQQATSRSMNIILASLVKEVANGKFLGDAMKPYDFIFGNLFLNVVRIGETSGTLSENLNYISNELAKKKQIRTKVIGALVYPAILMIGVMGIVSMLIFFIFPKILPVFASLKTQLPAPTRLLIFISDIALNYTATIAIGVLIIVVTWWIALQNQRIRRFMHQFSLIIPVYGKLVVAVSMTNFCRTLALLLKSGVTIVDALNGTAETVDNVIYREKILAAAEHVRNGGQISEKLKSTEMLFPIMAVQMIEIGEDTGNLSETLFYLASFYEESIDDIVKNLTTMLEPAILIIMGGIVGFVALAIILPIYGITQNIG